MLGVETVIIRHPQITSSKCGHYKMMAMCFTFIIYLRFNGVGLLVMRIMKEREPSSLILFSAARTTVSASDFVQILRDSHWERCMWGAYGAAQLM